MLSQTAEYALRAVVCVAGSSEPITARRVAERVQAPSGYLAKVLQLLARAGLVKSQRGVRGGFRLALPPEEISLLDVINAVDPLRRVDRCPLGLKERGERLCPLHRQMDEAILEAQNSFARRAVADLLRAAPDENFPMGLCAQPRRGDLSEVASAPQASSAMPQASSAANGNGSV
jgi:Rrf2 family nitric oxide-sensitive transcriptional repressor